MITCASSLSPLVCLSLSMTVLSVSCRCDISAHISGLPLRAGPGAPTIMHCICLLFIYAAHLATGIWQRLPSWHLQPLTQQGSKLPGTQMDLALVLAICTSGA